MHHKQRLYGRFSNKSKLRRANRAATAVSAYRNSKTNNVDDSLSTVQLLDSERENAPPTQADNGNVHVDVNSWNSGRRIVELGHMAKQMNCTDCDKTLNLFNIVNETRYGFGSLLLIECECGIVNEVTTGKTHRVGARGPPVFDVNTKAALGMY